jgi:periplasmic divalent cation tolerance protein
MTGARLVLSSVAGPGEAERIADTLVGEGLAACVTLIEGGRSVYRWRGALEHASETLLLIKCRTDAYARLEARLRALHPYAVPEILCVPVETGLAEYLAWLEQPDA